MTGALSDITVNDIEVFQSLTEIPALSFPMKLDRLLLVVCSRGEITAAVDVIRRRVAQRDIMVLRPGHLISECVVSEDFEGFFITATQEHLNLAVPSIRFVVPFSIRFSDNPVIHIDDEELTSLRLAYDMLRSHLQVKSRPYHGAALAAMCEVLFYNTLGIYSSRVKDTACKSRRQELLTRFIELVEDNFKAERSVGFYAGRLYVTPKHLSAVIKEMSDLTAGEWIDRRVILEAKNMLRSTGMNIQEISGSLNFANQSFFGKYFKHLTGVSPRDYRSKMVKK